MPEYTCEHCDKVFSQLSNYKNHINTKIKCYERIFKKVTDENPNFEQFLEINTCIYCESSFKSKKYVMQHIKLNCKEFKRREQEKKEIYEKLKEQEEKSVLKQKNTELEEENKKLKQMLDDANKSKAVNVNNSNNSNSNINSNNNVVQNIVLVGYGQEEVNKIDQKMLLRAIGRGFQSTVNLTETIHFNPKHPEFHNVYIPSIKDKYAMKYDGKNWNLVDKNGLIDEIYNEKRDYVAYNRNDFYDDLTEAQIASLEKWLMFDENNPEDACIKSIKADIKLMLYNKKNIPIATKSKMAKS